MGSPILFFNTMLGVDPTKVKEFAKRNSDYSLKWLNVIDSSDIIAYPLKASFHIDALDSLNLQDVYVNTTSNPAATAARSMGQDIVAMALDAGTSHVEYCNCPRVAQLIADNLQDREEPLLANKIKYKYIQHATDSLQSVRGMSVDKLKLHINDNPVAKLSFSDGSGTLLHVVNLANVHHVYLFDHMNFCRFSGYVGWMDTQRLQRAIESIKRDWC